MHCFYNFSKRTKYKKLLKSYITHLNKQTTQRTSRWAQDIYAITAEENTASNVIPVCRTCICMEVDGEKSGFVKSGKTGCTTATYEI